MLKRQAETTSRLAGAAQDCFLERYRRVVEGWIPVRCPIVGCDYVDEFRLDTQHRTTQIRPAGWLGELCAEHPAHPTAALLLTQR